MKKLSFLLAVAAMLASATAGAALRSDLLGDNATPEQAQRTIVILPTTKYVNVTQGEVVQFVENGSSFVWNFDGPIASAFDLNRVAPAGALDHKVTAYIASNPQYSN